MEPITLSVAYTLREYLSFAQDHAGVVLSEELAARGKAPVEKLPFHMRMTIATFAPLMFFAKKRRMPVCDFTIDDEGIVRVTADGRFVIPWDRVSKIHRYSQGYLVVKGDGAVPLPYRCFSTSDAAAFAELISRRFGLDAREPSGQ